MLGIKSHGLTLFRSGPANVPVRKHGRNVIPAIVVMMVVAAVHATAGTTDEASLLKLAAKHFTNKVSAAEMALFRAAVNGEELSRLTGTNDDPENASAWPPDRVILADHLAWLCTDPAASALVTYHGIKIKGVRMDGDFNLKWARIPFPLILQKCAFTNDIVLLYSHLRALSLTGSHLRNLRGDGLEVEKDVFLRDGFQAAGNVSLIGAAIGGDLDCRGARFSRVDTNTFALCLERATINGAVLMGADPTNPFSAHGGVDLTGATIGGDLDCSGGQFFNFQSNQCALTVQRAKINGDVFLGADATNVFKAQGNVDVSGATIGGNLDCGGGWFFNPNATALDAAGAKINGDVLLGTDAANVFKAQGKVDVSDATIGGKLDCGGGQFFNPNAAALDVAGAKIEGPVYLYRHLRADGEVRLLNTTIGEDLHCEGGQFMNPPGSSLALDGAKIEGSVFLKGPFTSRGKVRLTRAFIRGNLDCGGGRFLNLDHIALEAEGLTVEGAVLFDAQGTHHFEMAGLLDLQNGKVGVLSDESVGWPLPDNLLLNNFAYDEIEDRAAGSATSRIAWLRLQKSDSFSPQSYEQLARVLRNMGHEEEASTVMVRMNEDYAQHLVWEWPSVFHWSSWLHFLGTCLSWMWYHFFGELIGFGYKVWRALGLSLIFVLAGWLLFKLGYCAGMIKATDKDAYLQPGAESRLTETYPRFCAFIYSLEMFAPLVKLEMGDFWRPVGEAGQTFCLKPDQCLLLKPLLKKEVVLPKWSGTALRWYLWLHIIAGWILTSLWIVGFTGLVKT